MVDVIDLIEKNSEERFIDWLTLLSIKKDMEASDNQRTKKRWSNAFNWYMKNKLTRKEIH